MYWSSKLTPSVKELEMRNIARRKIVVTSDLEIGHIITNEDIEYKRSDSVGLAPKNSVFLINRKLKQSKLKSQTLTLKDFE